MAPMIHDLILTTILLTASYIALKWADGRLKQLKQNRRGKKCTTDLK